MAAGHNWRHNWTPLTMAAALQKAHGSRRGAVKALGSSRSQQAATRKVTTSTRKAAKAIGATPATAAPRSSGRQLSAGYIAGKGASGADVATLITRYQQMHGKPPTAKQIAKIKRAK